MKNRKKTIKKQESKISRRDFISGAAAAVAFTAVPRHVLGGPGHTPPSEKLNIAAIGVGGMGGTDLKRMIQQVDEITADNIIALCDVDQELAAHTYELYPKAKKYIDFRKMLEKEKSIDAVIVATPDHLHAVVTMAALKMGKHVYCEKPLTHTVYEARMIAKAAREAAVATQMGNAGQASEESRLICEWIWDGAIGPVREVHVVSERPGSQYGWATCIPRPKETPPVPSTLNWDLWLGPAPHRPYNPVYLPFKWRGWRNFGTSALGDMGCHKFHPIFRALKLGRPISAEACSTAAQFPKEVSSETYPLATMVRYEFAARGDMPPVKLTWYDGGLMPPRPEELEQERRVGRESTLYIGDKGKLLDGRLIPESRMKEYKLPPKTMPRSPGHYTEWIQACKGGKPAGANFDIASVVAEAVLLGDVALRTGKKLHWDGPNMKVTNAPEANEYLHRQYRQGWTL